MWVHSRAMLCCPPSLLVVHQFVINYLKDDALTPLVFPRCANYFKGSKACMFYCSQSFLVFVWMWIITYRLFHGWRSKLAHDHQSRWDDATFLQKQTLIFLTPGDPEAFKIINSSKKEPSIAASIYLFIHLYSCPFFFTRAVQSCNGNTQCILMYDASYALLCVLCSWVSES